MNCPVVLVISSCPSTPARDVIANIRKLQNEEKVYEQDGYRLYLHDIKTKYYNTEIAFLPLENTENLNEVVNNRIEGFIFYLDSNDRSVLEMLPKHVDFIKTHQIEFCMVLCNELPEDDKTGVTFKCIKDCYSMLDIIELEKTSCEDAEEDDEENLFNPSGYEELAQALRSVIWSNVDVNHVSSNGISSKVDNGHEDELEVESELENFEKLLNQMIQFRPATSNMSRDDRLNCAQDFAEIFEKLIMQDEENVNTLDSN